MKFFSREFRESGRNSIEIRVIRGLLISKCVSPVELTAIF